MKITVVSSKAVKPDYGSNGGGAAASSGTEVVPLTVFDKVTFNQHISGISFFHPPAPPNDVLEAGLARALAECREWAGRLGVHGDGSGSRVIVLNDAGARFVEATADVALDSVMPLEPTPAVLSLHPSGKGAEELVLVQVTRFACGSIAVGRTMHHAVGDARAAGNFLVAWCQATRGAAFDPVPVHDRASLFLPLDPPPPVNNLEHRGVEFKQRRRRQGENNPARSISVHDDMVVVQRVRFTGEFVSELRTRAWASAGAGAPRPTRLQCVMAHLWRCITKARGLEGHEVTRLRIAVDGRTRMRHLRRVADGYTGNVVLWAWPTTTAGELLSRPLGSAVELISREVGRIDDGYFRSFIRFASSRAVEEERLEPTADPSETVLSPDVHVFSLLHVPFHHQDFGAGPPFFYMPSYLPEEGCVFVVPSSFSGGDDDRSGGIDAYVPLFSRAMDTFKRCCYSLPMDARLQKAIRC